jgi:hypothetical protein
MKRARLAGIRRNIDVAAGNASRSTHD